jgi:hypothetical protein
MLHLSSMCIIWFIKKKLQYKPFQTCLWFFHIEFFYNVYIITLTITPKRIWGLPNWQRSWKLMKIKLYAKSKLNEYCHNPNIGFVIKCGV